MVTEPRPASPVAPWSWRLPAGPAPRRRAPRRRRPGLRRWSPRTRTAASACRQPGRRPRRSSASTSTSSTRPATPRATRPPGARWISAFAVTAGGTFNDVLAHRAPGTCSCGRTSTRRRSGSTGSRRLIRTRPRAHRADTAGCAEPAAGRAGPAGVARWSDFPTLYEDGRWQVRVASTRRSASSRTSRRGSATRRRSTRVTTCPRPSRGPSSASRPAPAAFDRWGTPPVYVYGAAIVSGVWHVGAGRLSAVRTRRRHGEVEQLYGGAPRRPAQAGAAAFDFSVGRQRSSASIATSCSASCWGRRNGADRGAAYLAPRKAQDLVVNARLRYRAAASSRRSSPTPTS